MLCIAWSIITFNLDKINSDQVINSNDEKHLTTILYAQIRFAYLIRRKIRTDRTTFLCIL